MIFHLFRKKKRTTNITLDEVEPWMKKTLDSKNIGLKISILKRELHSKKTKIRELLVELQEAKIKDESVIPERAKNMFKGNKEAYVQKISLFLDELRYPEEISELESFLEETSTKIEELAQETNKNFFIIKEFAEDEARNVANKISELDKLITNARETIEKSSLSKFKELKKLLEEYKESNSKLEETKQELENVLQRKAEELKRRKKIETKIATIKKSPQHEDHTRLKNKKEKIEEEVKKTEYTIINLFSGISSALKKYSKKKRNKTAKEYSENAVKALINDEKINIMKTINDLEKIKDTLDIKGTKLKKLDTEIKAINQKNLEQLRKHLIEKSEEAKETENCLKNHSYTLNIKEQEGLIKGLDENIKEIENEEQKIEDQLERNNPRLIKQKIKRTIKEIDEKTELI